MIPLEACTVLVTPRSYGAHDPALKTDLEQAAGHVVYNTTGRSLRSDELVGMVGDVDGMIAGLDNIDQAVIEAASRLRVIARYGVGVDNVDLDAARSRGIVVTNTPGANAASVAELAVGFMLALARQIPQTVAATRSGEWPRVHGLTLDGKVVGLLGFGAVGKQVARRLEAFGCCVIAHDPFVGPDEATVWGVELLPREEVVRRADFLSLHVPVLPETRGMVNAAFLAQMKPGAYLVNTARGELVDEVALYDALQRGHVRGAALDTLRDEPPDPGHPLLALPQLLVTSHTGAHTDGAANTMGRMAMNDCLAVLRGSNPAYRVV
jgi:D-3-phosphoglycerate dehydrogenase